MKKILKRFENDKVSLIYLLDTDTGTVGMTLLPKPMSEDITTDGKWEIENLIQVKLVGDAYPDGFSEGISMRNSESCKQLKYIGQSDTYENGVRRIITQLRSTRISAEHVAEMHDGRAYISLMCTVENTSDSVQKIEMVSSFSICDLSPVGENERISDYNLYRMQSRWSGEGKIQKQNLLDLHMEPSWLRLGVNSLRWGQIGSMPVRGYFPWGVFEDSKYGYMVGAQLYYNGSWQMELYEKDDKVSFSGGIADREFGHFLKQLDIGERLETPEAVIAAVCGDLDELCDGMLEAQEDKLSVPKTEEELPPIFNEYCTTWGNPTEENIRRIIETIRGKGFRYFVIDAGWYSIGDGEWFDDQGDWNVNKRRFPDGLKTVAARIRDAGMIPGIWYEYECIGRAAEAYRQETLQLKRDGLPISDNGKRFWDMRLPQVIKYLDEKVIAQLQDYGFGYIKVDYNGNYGIGPDGKDGFGEELRQSVIASREYFKRMRRKIPELIIENCASGGHRLEPSMMQVCSMASFSDAHECVTIPIIAANLHRAILPRQSQIWAVLRKKDTDRRLIYSLAAGLLGRLCISGDVYDLSEHQWQIVDEGISFYREAVPVIRTGCSKKQGGEIRDYSHPTGYQAVVRTGKGQSDGKTLIVVHAFSGWNDTLIVYLDDSNGKIRRIFAGDEVKIIQEDNRILFRGMTEFSAAAVLLDRE